MLSKFLTFLKSQTFIRYYPDNLYGFYLWIRKGFDNKTLIDKTSELEFFRKTEFILTKNIIILFKMSLQQRYKEWWVCKLKTYK